MHKKTLLNKSVSVALAAAMTLTSTVPAMAEDMTEMVTEAVVETENETEAPDESIVEENIPEETEDITVNDNSADEEEDLQVIDETEDIVEESQEPALQAAAPDVAAQTAEICQISISVDVDDDYNGEVDVPEYAIPVPELVLTNGKENRTLKYNEGTDQFEGEVPYGDWTIAFAKAADSYHDWNVTKKITLNDAEQDFGITVSAVKKAATISFVDSETGKIIKSNAAKVELYDDFSMEGTPFTVKNSSGKAATSFTAENGTVRFGSELYCGKYTVKTIQAPDGYTIDSETQMELAKSSGQNTDIKISCTAVKQDASCTVTDSKKGKALNGRKLSLTAEEDITDQNGTVLIKKGESVAAENTDNTGKAVFKNLRPGKYAVTSEADDIYEAKKCSITVTGSDKAEIKLDLSIFKGTITVKRNDYPGSGMEYQVIAENVCDGNRTERDGFAKGTVVETIKTASNSTAVTKNLPAGTYKIVESYCKEDFTHVNGEFPVTIKNGALNPVVAIDAETFSQELKLTVSDIETKKAVGKGFTYDLIAEAVLDGAGEERPGYEKGKVIATVSTDANGVCSIPGLYTGKYILKAKAAKSGYALSLDETEIQIKNNGSSTKTEAVTVEPTVVEILSAVKDTNTSINMVTYHAGVKFRVKKSGTADNDSQIYTTDKNGKIRIPYLEANTSYSIQQISAVQGYTPDGTVRVVKVEENGRFKKGEDTTSSMQVEFCSLGAGEKDPINKPGEEKPGAVLSKELSVSMKENTYSHTGSKIEPAVEVKLSNGKVLDSAYYLVTYENNINEGTAIVTVTGKGLYTGFKGNGTFTIEAKNRIFTVTGLKEAYDYTGAALKPKVKVQLADGKVLSSADYSVSYNNNLNPGKATVTIKGKGTYWRYSGTASFQISPTFAVKASKATYTYSGRAFKPAVTVKIAGKKISSRYYTVSYKNNKNVGTATVEVKGKGRYSKFKGTSTFRIVPKKAALSSTGSTRNKLSLKWRKVTGANTYEVQVATNRKFTSGLKTYKVTKNTLSVSGLKRRTRYYIRMRAVRHTKAGNYYGAWSSVKNKKTK